MSLIDKYPLKEKRPELVKSITGKKLDDITLQEIVNGNIKDADIRISPETLELHAQIAEEQGRTQFAENMRRAIELCNIPDERILDIYDKLRPYRCTKQELLDIADELQNVWYANKNADLVREAAHHYEERDVLKKA